jgi:hypothetical protein
MASKGNMKPTLQSDVSLGRVEASWDVPAKIAQLLHQKS